MDGYSSACWFLGVSQRLSKRVSHRLSNRVSHRLSSRVSQRLSSRVSHRLSSRCFSPALQYALLLLDGLPKLEPSERGRTEPTCACSDGSGMLMYWSGAAVAAIPTSCSRKRADLPDLPVKRAALRPLRLCRGSSFRAQASSTAGSAGIPPDAGTLLRTSRSGGPQGTCRVRRTRWIVLPAPSRPGHISSCADLSGTPWL